MKIYVISNNTPIILHYFLKSLFASFNLEKKEIFVVHTQNQIIDYKKVHSCFPEVSFISAKSIAVLLNKLLISLKNDSCDYIVCSDTVIFNKNHDFKKMVNILDSYGYDNFIKYIFTDHLHNSYDIFLSNDDLMNNIYDFYYRLITIKKYVTFISVNYNDIELIELLSYLYNYKNVVIDCEEMNGSRDSVIDIKKMLILKPYYDIKFKDKIIDLLKKILGRNKIVIKDVIGISENREFRIKKPNILSIDESIELLDTSPRSFTRFGDGELNIINEEGIPFQQYDPRLKDYLVKLIKNADKDFYIGLPKIYFDDSGVTDMVKNYVSIFSKKIKSIISLYCSESFFYLDTTLTQVYQTYKEYDFDTYFNKIRNLFLNKKITLVIGEGIYQKFDHSLFDLCSDVDIIEGPKKNAFSELDRLINEIEKRDKSRLICVVLGPTAKAITFEMTKKGYLVWDIGHLLKDYDFYMKRIPRTKKEISNFFSPD